MTIRQESRPEVTQAFPVPVILFDVPDAPGINRELSSIILQRQQRDPGITRSNIHGWHSTDDLLEWGGSTARQVATAFGNIAATITEFPRKQGVADLCWAVQMWANVSARGASSQLHCHPGAYWSGVYYVDDGGYMQDANVGGHLILHSPYESVASMYAPDIHVKLPTGQRLSHTRLVRPRAGRGIIFPSWLMHRVEPYDGPGVRISVALNFSLPLQR